MMYRHIPPLLRLLPDALQRHVLHFEAEIEQAARRFAADLPANARVLDAGAGEAQYAPLFSTQRYTAVDLGVGDATWHYGAVHAFADLQQLPFRGGVFTGAVNIVTLEHVLDPGAVIAEIARVLEPGGRLLLVTPLEWEEHQTPYDFFRFTRYGVAHVLRSAGLEIVEIHAVGGFFRLLARRLLNSAQFFPIPVRLLAYALLAPPAVLMPLLDGLDRERRFTLGHICVARKP